MKQTLRTYEELNKHAQAFGRGQLNLLLLIGDAGLGKSRVVKAAAGDGAQLVQGQVTALQLYCKLFRHRDALFVIDDVDDLCRDRDAVRLLKCLCQSESEKTLSWNTGTSKLAQEHVEREFTTRTRVAIIANSWKAFDMNVAAVENRGHLVFFRPSAEEVHRWVASWRRDKGVDDEVYQHIGERLRLIGRLSG